MYGKIDNGVLRYCPSILNGVINPSVDKILAAGYVPIEHTDPPKVDTGFYAESHWEQEDNKIIQKWSVVKDRRPLSSEEAMDILLKQQINTLDVDDETALRLRGYYPEWEPEKQYAVGSKVLRNGLLYKVTLAHTSQIGWEPEVANTMFVVINETHSGDQYDPIPYMTGMALENGKYYTEDDVVYLCTRDTINPVYVPLKDLVGLYV